jgi:hypothetical protein
VQALLVVEVSALPVDMLHKKRALGQAFLRPLVNSQEAVLNWLWVRYLVLPSAVLKVVLKVILTVVLKVVLLVALLEVVQVSPWAVLGLARRGPP